MRAMRVFACGLGMLASLGVLVGAGVVPFGSLSDVVSWVAGNLGAFVAGSVGASLLIYAASCAVSVAIYERKDL